MKDLLTGKTVAARPRDWLDIEAIIIKQSKLDWEYILQTINGLDAYEDISGRIEKLNSLKSEYYQR